jgi:hypothetical protein
MSDHVAKFPISWIEFQSLMQNLGYDGLSLRQSTRTARFFRGKSDREGIVECVTVALPTFIGRSGMKDSYERDYVADVIDHATGGNGGEAVAAFLAKRRRDD